MYMIRERGNGLPNVGDLVLLECSHGFHQLKVITEMSSIFTELPGRGNYVYVDVKEPMNDWDDYKPAVQDKFFERLSRLEPEE